MAQGNETATFRVDIEGNAADKAAAAADAMEDLRRSIASGQGGLRQMTSLMKNLSGETDEVKAAKDSLKASIEKERAAVSASTLELLKQQKAYGDTGGDAKKLAAEKAKLSDKVKAESKVHAKLADDLKKGGVDTAAAKHKALGAAISTAGGPVAALRDKLSTLKDVMGEGGAGGAASILTLGAAGLAAALVAVVAAVGAGVYAFGRFILKGADAARSAALLREAAVGGNAQWGKNFGDQVDLLAEKVPTSKEKINEMGLALTKSRIGGQVWVDTLTAVTQASAALGDEAGAKIKGFIERGRLLGKLQIDPQEMIDPGLDFNDVSAALAKSMKIGVKEAALALRQGRVKLEDGAAALAAASTAKLGGTNLRQMLSMDNIVKKLGESFDALTKNVNIEPILKGFKELADMFKLDSVTGQALKTIVEVFGKEMGLSISSSTPLVKKFIHGLIDGALDIGIAYFTLRNALRDTFANSKVLGGIDVMKTGVTLLKVALGAAALAVGAFMAAGAMFYTTYIKPFADLITLVEGLGAGFKAQYEAISGTDWKGLGASVVAGLIVGLKSGAGALGTAVLGLGDVVKKSFKDVLGIHSPSKVFEEYGQHTTSGYAQGVDKGSGDAQSAVNAMVSAPSSGGGGGGGGMTVNITINAGGGNAKEVAAAVSSASVIEQITKGIIDAMHGGGVGVPA